MSDSKRRTDNPIGWIPELLARAFEPSPQPVPVRVRSTQATALVRLQRRSRAARMVH